MTLGTDQAPPDAATPDLDAPAGEDSTEVAQEPGFRVKLRNFEGPFDLLLNLISQHRLDVTEVALHEVTDDFIAYTRELGPEMGLDQTTEFLVVAATLLDLKAARLLPSGEVDDPEDLALLEARDLLFARLLQYRAYKQVAALFGELEAAALQRYPRAVSLEKRFEDLLPEVTLGVDADGFAQVAAAGLTPRPVPTVGLDHLHDVQKVSVPGQARRMASLLSAASGTWLSFRELTADCANGLEIVGSFLGLLELFRERAVAFEQPVALEELAVMWTSERGADDLRIDKSEDYG
ncbi:segregation and condensation protein A [Gordonia terrae]